MKLRFDDRFITLADYTKKEKLAVKSRFTWEDRANAFAGGKFDVRKIKKVCFVKEEKGYIKEADKNGYMFLDAGFLKEFLELLKKLEVTPDYIDDQRTKLPYQQTMFRGLEEHFPYEYNKHQVNTLKILLRVNNGIVKIPTGGGKGDILVAFLKEAGLSSLIIVNKVALCDQLAKRARDSGIEDVGVWHGKIKETGRFQFATIQSVKSLPAFDEFKILILDEVHHASANSYQEFLESFPVPVRLGFSATPDKGDDYSFALVRRFIGPVISEVLAPELIDNKVIALPKITFVTVNCQDTLDWPSAHENCIINNHERNMKIADLVERHDEPTLILIKDVKHKQGELIKDTIEENTNKTVEYMHGSSKHDRLDVIRRFEDGEIDVLVATNILNEGISIKRIKVLINASGGKSKVENLQKLGRGTRIMDGKEEVRIYDFFDKGNRYTEKHSLLREKVYQKEGFTEIVHEK